MENEYVTPEMLMEEFKTEDIITTSGPGGIENPPDGYDIEDD